VTRPTTTGADLASIERRVRETGGRMTVSTRALVEILASTDRHLTVDDLTAELERRAPGVAPSTVYRVLQRLDEIGVVEHVHSGLGPTFYHLREAGHAHLVCNDCGAIIDIPDGVFAHLADAVRREHGFEVDAHHVALLGRCGACTGPS